MWVSRATGNTSTTGVIGNSFRIVGLESTGCRCCEQRLRLGRICGASAIAVHPLRTPDDRSSSAARESRPPNRQGFREGIVNGGT